MKLSDALFSIKQIETYSVPELLMYLNEKMNVILSITEGKFLNIDVRDFGCFGDGEHDDTEAIQDIFDSIEYIDKNTSLPTKSITINFPYGHYVISRPLVIKAPTIINGNNAILEASRPMGFILSFDNEIQIPNIVINDLNLHGKGLARKGLYLKDVYNARINRIGVFACTEHCILADKEAGKSKILEFSINEGTILSGINPNAGSFLNCVDSIGLEMRTTDCLIYNLYTRDFKQHIVNSHGVNFYNHCHGWNQYLDILGTGGLHFKVGWDIVCNSCYSDTFTIAFQFVGDARAEITNHLVFANKDFYDDKKYDCLQLFKVSGTTKGNKVRFMNCRFDNNGLSSRISYDDYPHGFEFIGCTSNFSSDNYVVNGDKQFSQPSIISPDVSVFGWHCVKPTLKEVHLQFSFYLAFAVASTKPTIEVCQMPEGTYNKYYTTTFPVMIEEQNTFKALIGYGKITPEGKLYIKLNGLDYTPTSNIDGCVNACYYITY